VSGKRKVAIDFDDFVLRERMTDGLAVMITVISAGEAARALGLPPEDHVPAGTQRMWACCERARTRSIESMQFERQGGRVH
jgi:hypothetical protein